jgi:hypothetical protein
MNFTKINLVLLNTGQKKNIDYLNFTDTFKLPAIPNKMLTELDSKDLILHKLSSLFGVNPQFTIFFGLVENQIKTLHDCILNNKELSSLGAGGNVEELIYKYVFNFVKGILVDGILEYIEHSNSFEQTNLIPLTIYVISLEKIVLEIIEENDLSIPDSMEKAKLICSIFGERVLDISPLSNLIENRTPVKYNQLIYENILYNESKFFSKLGYPYMISNLVQSSFKNILFKLTFDSTVDIQDYFLEVDKGSETRSEIKYVYMISTGSSRFTDLHMLQVNSKVTVFDTTFNITKVIGEYDQLKHIVVDYMFIACNSYNIILCKTEMYVLFDEFVEYNIDTQHLEDVYKKFQNQTLNIFSMFFKSYFEQKFEGKKLPRAKSELLCYDLIFSCKQYGKPVTTKHINNLFTDEYMNIFGVNNINKNVTSLTTFTLSHDPKFEIIINVKKKNVQITTRRNVHYNFTSRLLVRNIFAYLINGVMLPTLSSDKQTHPLTLQKDKYLTVHVIDEIEQLKPEEKLNYFKYLDKFLVPIDASFKIVISTADKTIRAAKKYSVEKPLEIGAKTDEISFKQKQYVLKENVSKLVREEKIGQPSELRLINLPDIDSTNLYIRGNPYQGFKGYLNSICMLLNIELKRLIISLQEAYKNDEHIYEDLRDIEQKEDEVYMSDDHRQLVDTYVYYTYGNVSVNIYFKNTLTSHFNTDSNLIINKYETTTDNKTYSTFYNPIIEMTLQWFGVKSKYVISKRIFNTINYENSYDNNVLKFIKTNKEHIVLLVNKLSSNMLYIKGLLYRESTYIPIENYLKIPNIDEYEQLTKLENIKKININDSLSRFLSLYEADEEERIIFNYIKHGGLYKRLIFKKYKFYFESENLQLDEFSKKVQFNSFNPQYDPAVYDAIDYITNEEQTDFLGNTFKIDSNFYKGINEHNYLVHQYNIYKLMVYKMFRDVPAKMNEYIAIVDKDDKVREKKRATFLKAMTEKEVVLTDSIVEFRENILKTCKEQPGASYCTDTKTKLLGKHYEAVVKLFVIKESIYLLKQNVQTSYMFINPRLRNDAEFTQIQ